VRVRTAVAVVAATASMTSALALAAPGAANVSQAVGRGVCTGVRGCHVVARADVNGDGAVDVIGVARRGANGAPRGAVIVRVKTGPGSIVSVRRPTEYWGGHLWQGRAFLDGHKGKELVVGFTSGAHYQAFRALTWRRGSLVTLNAPGRGKFWGIDGAVWVAMGWQRRHHDPVGTIRKRVAIRTGDPIHSPFKGRITTFKWRHDGWHRVSFRTVYPLPDHVAYSWGGFQVPGLQRW
jgi:hypothetical protein